MSINEKENPFLKTHKRSKLNFVTAGNVDDGKSTLIGRLLNDSNNLTIDKIDDIKDVKNGLSVLAHASDGLAAEREQGITIDVAYKYFSTKKRSFILADAPGHLRYTKNMLSAVSRASLAILLIDASKEIQTQTKRHAFLLSLFKVPKLVVAVNKMDLVNYSEISFEKIRNEFIAYSQKLRIDSLEFVPISALDGDNVVHSSQRMSWYKGSTILTILENTYSEGDCNLIDFRFPVQCVSHNKDSNFLLGRVESGSVKVNEDILVLPSRFQTKVKSIVKMSSEGKEVMLNQASFLESIAISLHDKVQVSRGDMIVKVDNQPKSLRLFEAMLVWFGEEETKVGREYIIYHSHNETQICIENIKYVIDVDTLSKAKSTSINVNQVGRVVLRASSELYIDEFQNNKSNGSFILIDPITYSTIAAGLIIDKAKLSSMVSNDSQSNQNSLDVKLISKKNKPQTLWLTGLSASGKSTIAREIEKKLSHLKIDVFWLDGDIVRTGLCKDLSFSKEDRSENIRRVSEVAKLFNQAGVFCICSFITPFEDDRILAKKTIGEENYIEVFVDTDLEVCEKRDPKNLYIKARRGEIKNFTGIDSPYEKPIAPNIAVDAGSRTIEDCVEQIMAYLGEKVL